MILKELGQTFRLDQTEFKVGDFAAVYVEPELAVCGVILEIDTDSQSAQIDFGEDGAHLVPLGDMTPLPVQVPAETGKQYVLYYVRTGAMDQCAKVLGISESRNLLIYRMLEAVNSFPGMRLTFANADDKLDALQFIYDLEKPGNQCHLDYAIVPAAVYSKAKGGDAV